jgi:hypothetical protein
LYEEGDDGHVSESSSTTTSSNDSNCPIELPVEVNRCEERLMELKRSLLGNWIEGVEKNLFSNPHVSGLNSIASLQFFFSRTIEFASSKLNDDSSFK